MKRNFSIGRAIGWGFQTFFDNIVLFLSILVIYAFVVIGLKVLLMHFSKVTKGLIYIIVYLVLVGFYIGYTKIRLDLYDKKDISLKALFDYYHLVPQVIIGGIAYMLLTLAGLVLFIIPGIFIALRYAFFYYALVDKDLGIQESFNHSAQLTEGIKLDLFLLYLVCAIINMIPIFMPATGLALVYAYKKQSEVFNQTGLSRN